MNRSIGMPHSLAGDNPAVVDDLLDAADRFSRQFDVDPEELLAGIAQTLKRRVEFDRLRDRFGVSLPRP